MTNLNEVEESIEFDDAMDWAVAHEYELRFHRYELFLNGGFTGAAKRVTESLESLTRVLAGDR